MPNMPNLGHIDRPLTNMSVAYQQADNAFIHDKVFPIVPVQKQSDIYFRYSRDDFFRDEVQKRGQGVESVGGQWNVEKAPPYYCEKYAYHIDITKEELINYDAPIDVMQDSVDWLSHKMLLHRENQFLNNFFKTGVWATDMQVQTPDKWSNPSSDPVSQVSDIIIDMARKTAKRPNTMIMSPDVWYKLKNHEALVDRIKYTQKGIVGIDLVASLFEVDRILIPWGVQNVGAQQDRHFLGGDHTDDRTPPVTFPGTQDKMDFFYSGKVLFCWTPPRPTLKSPAAGVIFAWTGLEGAANAFGSRIVRLPMDVLGLGTQRLEIENAYDMQVICNDMGYFLYDVI